MAYKLFRKRRSSPIYNFINDKYGSQWWEICSWDVIDWHWVNKPKHITSFPLYAKLIIIFYYSDCINMCTMDAFHQAIYPKKIALSNNYLISKSLEFWILKDHEHFRGRWNWNERFRREAFFWWACFVSKKVWSLCGRRGNSTFSN